MRPNVSTYVDTLLIALLALPACAPKKSPGEELADLSILDERRV